MKNNGSNKPGTRTKTLGRGGEKEGAVAVFRVLGLQYMNDRKRHVQ